jgi:DNA-binding MarR family transcriptional regulator
MSRHDCRTKRTGRLSFCGKTNILAVVTHPEEQAMAVADAVRAAARATVAATRASQGLPALPEAQVDVLRTLRSSPSMTPAELAQRLGLARPTVSNLLHDLEAAGHVTRARSEVDGRSVILTITEKARGVQDAFQRGRGEVVTSAWAALDEGDRTALAAATPSLRRLADRLHNSAPSTAEDEINR